ncbi:hypothetical protein ACP5PY_26700 [Photobacterium leiognathi subsp. mandapamensis]
MIDEQKAQKRQYQKANRAKHKSAWQAEKQRIDSMTVSELKQYLQTTDRAAIRAGMHSFKVNGYELALIRLTIEQSGCRGTRELFLKLLK